MPVSILILAHPWLLAMVSRDNKDPYYQKEISACDEWIYRLSMLNILWKEVRRFIYFLNWKWESHRHVVVAMHIPWFVWSVLLVTFCSGIGYSVPHFSFLYHCFHFPGFIIIESRLLLFISLLEWAACDTGDGIGQTIPGQLTRLYFSKTSRVT